MSSTDGSASQARRTVGRAEVGANCLWLDAAGTVVAAGTEFERRLDGRLREGMTFPDLLLPKDRERGMRMLVAAREFKLAAVLGFAAGAEAGVQLAVRAEAAASRPEVIVVTLDATEAAGPRPQDLSAAAAFASGHRVALPDGRARWIEGAAGLLTDVTATQAEGEASRHQARLLTSVTDSIPALVAYWTADLRCTFANNRYQQWFGRSHERMRQIRLPELLGPELFRLNEPYILGALAGTAQGFERDLTLADGSVRHTWAQYIPDVENGSVKGMFALVTDITELKRTQQQLQQSQQLLALEASRRGQAESALRESRLMYGTLLHTMHSGFAYCRCIFDGAALVDYEYLEVNAAYEALMAVTGTVGRRASEVWFHRQRRPGGGLDLYARVAGSGQSESAEVHAWWLDRWLAVSVSRPSVGHLFIVFDDITERKKALDRLRTIFAASPAAIGIARRSDGRLVEVNKAFLSIFGYRRDEVVGRTSAELGLWRDDAARLQMTKELARTGHVRGLRVDIATKSGAPGRMLASLESVQIDGAWHVVGSFVDVSELEQAQVRLQESERDYDALFRNMPSAFLSGRLIDGPDRSATFEFLRVNQVCFSLLGLGGIDGGPAHLDHATLARSYPQLVSRFWRVARTGDSEAFEFCTATPRRWLSGRVYSHRVGEFATTFEDITRRKERDLELQLSEARFQRLLNSNIVGVAIGDESGHLSFANDYYLKVIGVTRDELARGQIRWDQFSTPEELALDGRALEQVHTDGASAPYEKSVRRRDGSRVAVEIGLAAIPGDTAQVLAIVLDVTERRRAAEDLKRANEALIARTSEAEAANLAKSRFLSSINHELRTPVHTVLGYARLLLHRHPGQFSQQLQSIERAGVQLNRLIDDLLQISVNGQQMASLRRRPSDMKTLLRQLRDLGQRLQVAGHNRFDLVEIGTLPDRVSVDEDRLLQVLQNLLGNACKYTVDGQVVLSVACQPDPGQADQAELCRVEFAVTDTGAGIAPEERHRIFEAFQRGAAAKGLPGLGLGLSIARHWVEAMGSEIRLQSEPGKGSRFSFELALPVESPDRDPEPDRPPAPTGPGPQRHLLIVDDLAINRDYLTELCSGWGFGVAEAADVDTALQRCATGTPTIDAVLVDQSMPGKSGWDLLLELRKHPRLQSLPAILISASEPERPHGFPPDRHFDALLTKPFEVQTLLTALRTLLGVPNPPTGAVELQRLPQAPQDPGPTPPAPALDRYLDLLRLGRLFALSLWAQQLAESHPALSTVAAQVDQYCREADLPGLQALAAKWRPGSGGGT